MSTERGVEAQAQDKITVPEFAYFTKTGHHAPYDRISPLRPELSAHGRNIVVTGGGTGIGKGVAIAFAQAGANSVSILGRREDRLKLAVSQLQSAASAEASSFLYEVADLQDRVQVEKALDSIVKKVGKIDILVSNAGGLEDIKPVAAYDPIKFMKGFEVNVLTALNAVQTFLSRAGPKPVIISISSCIAHMSPMPMVSNYGVSKAANLKLMDYFAAENPDVHIVNVQPGTVATEMSQKAGAPGKDPVELPGQFCVWLASEEAKFLKSKFVWANWDVDELIARQDEIKNSRLFTWVLDGVPM